MGTVHRLLDQHGKEAALGADVDRRVVEAAAAYMGDEDGGIGFIYSGWAQAALPHRRLPDDQPWQIISDRVRLLVEPGRKPVDSRDAPDALQWVGVPYGSRARLILLFLQSEALKTNSREVELGRSLRAWLARLGIPIGGKSIKEVREQAERISRCRLTFHVQAGGRGGLVNQNIVDEAFLLSAEESDQGNLFVDTVKLSESFFEQLKKHPVPLEEAAIRALSNNSMALDLYCWLAYRLHVLPGSRPITWKALQAQFGTSYKELFHFKPRFIENLALARAVYPAADVTVDERGVTLRPSTPPVAKLGG
ncbi:plasmid replication initiator [Dankookia rubra]|uniref:Plasmid replication initiator n=1 Tax=Dankookia rubra TaxID=1442381 RepID=A0A4R5Q615_9PROT|nr:replication protein RepA [Dankookia rubra]TDH57993.1 plasmid replication initiator [Dankookia rubra]